MDQTERTSDGGTRPKEEPACPKCGFHHLKGTVRWYVQENAISELRRVFAPRLGNLFGLLRPSTEERNAGGWTLLMTAALYGSAEAATILLQCGANASATNKHGQTAEEIAIIYGHNKIATMVRNHRHSQSVPRDSRHLPPMCVDDPNVLHSAATKMFSVGNHGCALILNRMALIVSPRHQDSMSLNVKLKTANSDATIQRGDLPVEVFQSHLDATLAAVHIGYAVSQGDEQREALTIVRQLLLCGANPNLILVIPRIGKSWPQLHCSLVDNYLDLAETIAEFDVDTAQTDWQGKTAMTWLEDRLDSATLKPEWKGSLDDRDKLYYSQLVRIGILLQRRGAQFSQHWIDRVSALFGDELIYPKPET